MSSSNFSKRVNFPMFISGCKAKSMDRFSLFDQTDNENNMCNTQPCQSVGVKVGVVDENE